jgi:hypothetical protein
MDTQMLQQQRHPGTVIATAEGGIKMYIVQHGFSSGEFRKQR